MGNGRLCRRLGTSLGLLTVSIDVVVDVVQVEGTELYGSAVHFTVSGHAYGLFLVENAAVVARSPRRALRSLERGWGICGGGSGGGCARLLVLLLDSGDGRCRRAGDGLAGVVRVGGRARGCSARGRLGHVFDLFEVRLGEFVL